MTQTNRFSSMRLGYAICFGVIFILANTLMGSLASVLIDKYICLLAINICFFCLFVLLIIRRRLENRLPEYNYISYGKITFVLIIEWAITILCGQYAPDFFAPVIVLPILASTVFDDSLSNGLSLYMIIVSALCYDHSLLMVLCYLTMVLFGNLISTFFRQGKTIQKLYAFVIILAVCTLISAIFYYYNYIELSFQVFVYGLMEGLISCVLVACIVPLLNRFVTKSQEFIYDNFLDPDYPLNQEIRKFSYIEYQHALRLSNLSRKCAKAIGANEDLAACAGFYYRLGKIEGEPMIDNAIKIANNHCFPRDVIEILYEYGGIVALPSSKESAIVHMVDSVVTKVELFDKDSMTSTWNQNMVIYQTINELSQKGYYDNSGLTMNQFLAIREILANEDILA